MERFLKNVTLPKAFLLGFLLTLCYLSFLQTGPFLPALSLRQHDPWITLTYFSHPRPEHLSQIVIVAIDDESMEKVDQRWPWPRSLFGTILSKIAVQNPKVILDDATFTGKSPDPKEDEALAQAIRKAGNVVLPSSFNERGRYIPPLEPFGSSAFAYGLINKPRDSDFLIRRIKGAFLSLDGQLLDYSFEVVAMAKALGLSKSELRLDGRRIWMGNLFPVPVDRKGALTLNYQCPWLSFKTFPIWKVATGETPQDFFKDKMVIIGSTTEVFHDTHQTPLGTMPGVGVIANALLMFLNKDFLVPVPEWWNVVLLFCFAFTAIFLSYRLSVLKGLLTLFYLSAAILIATFFLRRHGVLWDYLNPILLSFLLYVSINLYKYIAALIENATLKEQAITDGLTGLYSFRYLDLRLQNELERAIRYRTVLSFLIMDLDHFKRVNDTYGHDVGNVVLKGLAEILRTRTRKADIAARYGGEEFCVILPNTELEGTRAYAEDIRKALEQKIFSVSTGESLKVTVSIGVTSVPAFGAKSAKELFEQADKALYQAKEGGRNRVVCYDSFLAGEAKA